MNSEAETAVAEIKAHEEKLKKLGYEHGWHKPERVVGYVYIAVNKRLPGMVKIGYADNLAKRIKNLGGTGMPDPYHCYAAYGVTSRLEDKALHSLIDGINPDIRYCQNREFYQMEPEQAFKIFENIAKFSGTQARLKTNPLNDAYFENPKKPDPAQTQIEVVSEKPSAWRRHISLAECGIGNGETIVCKDGCRVTVVDSEKDLISVPGEPDVKTMTGYCKKHKVHGNAETVQGSYYFYYNGTRVDSIMLSIRYPDGNLPSSYVHQGKEVRRILSGENKADCGA